MIHNYALITSAHMRLSAATHFKNQTQPAEITFIKKPANIASLTRCIQCKNEFEPSDVRNTLCGKKCARARKTLQARLGPIPVDKHCAWCGNKFVTSRMNMQNCSKECARKINNMKLRKWHDADKKLKMELVRPDIDRIIREAELPISDDEAWRILLARSSSRKIKTRMDMQDRKKMCSQCGKIFNTSAKIKPTCSAKCFREKKAAKRNGKA